MQREKVCVWRWPHDDGKAGGSFYAESAFIWDGTSQGVLVGMDGYGVFFLSFFVLFSLPRCKILSGAPMRRGKQTEGKQLVDEGVTTGSLTLLVFLL